MYLNAVHIRERVATAAANRKNNNSADDGDDDDEDNGIDDISTNRASSNVFYLRKLYTFKTSSK